MARTSARTGALLAGAAYVMWGLFPAFFRLLRDVAPERILAHRALWAGALSALLLAALGRGALRLWWRSAERNRQLGVLALTAALLGSNWGVYVYAVNSGQVLEASLGYFISPLVTVALGVAFLGERPGWLQRGALVLAALGVIELGLRAPALPWLSLYLACSFAAYGTLRKKLAMDPLLASAVESLLMAPPALVYLLASGAPRVTHGESALLLLSGAVTVLPLMLFAAGAKRLPNFSLGLLQYITPSLQLSLAVLAYHEPLSRPHQIAFALIWLAVGVSSLELLWKARGARVAVLSTRGDARPVLRHT